MKEQFNFRTWWPMGCKKIKGQDEYERLINNPKYVAQRKLDGVRCILQAEGLGGEMKFTTRGASLSDPTTTLDITHRLSHLSGLSKYLPFGVTLDGELYSGGRHTSAKIAGMVNYRSTVRVDRHILFYAFDILTFGGVDITNLPWYARMAYLDKVKAMANPDYIRFLPVAKTPEEKHNMYLTELSCDCEGIVLKNVNAIYKTAEGRTLKPTNTWYKMKKQDTSDVIITGSEPPSMYYKDPDTGKEDTSRLTKPYVRGWFGSITFTYTTDNGQIVTGACSGITDEKKEILSDGKHGINKEYIGRKMEVGYMEASKEGVLRHPRFIRIIPEGEK